MKPFPRVFRAFNAIGDESIFVDHMKSSVFRYITDQHLDLNYALSTAFILLEFQCGRNLETDNFTKFTNIICKRIEAKYFYVDRLEAHKSVFLSKKLVHYFIHIVA